MLIENEALRDFITSNHLHHKITKQHHARGLRVKIRNGMPYFPMAHSLNTKTHKAKTKWIALDALQIKRAEFLANGLEVHDAKRWQTLRPLYEMTVKNGQYVHIDTISGKQESIGKKGRNYIQLVTVKPWGYDPRGGALFRDTWIRFCN